MLMMNGKMVGSESLVVPISQADYDALPEAEKLNGTTYLVSDTSAKDYQTLLKLIETVGSEEELTGIADGTIVGAIKEIFEKLGGLSFSFDTANGYLQATYSDEVSPATVTPVRNYMSDSEKIAHMKEVVGDQSELAATGFSTVVGAIKDIYRRLNGLSFAMNHTTETVEVSYDDSAV